VPSFAALFLFSFFFSFRRALTEMRNTEKENAAENGPAAEGTVDLKSSHVYVKICV
jgi:hypothetical protein